jgi:glycosyltransferase involved in cell wall biosynthesis
MDLPLISIIVTTYNYAHTVGTAIDSALRQDYPNLEVVVVDNASTDATPELAARYAADPRFRYIRNAENIGMVPNHNKGLREARGSYVLFLSADDFLMPYHISRSYAYLQSHPDIDVLYTTTYFVDEEGGFRSMREMSGQPLAAYAGGRNEFAGLMIEGCYMCFPTMLMRRDLYDRFGELDEEIKAADYEIVVRWAAAGVRFGYLPEATCAVRLHSNQQSSAKNYVSDAGDLREFVYLLKKFAAQNAERLDGYENQVSRHLWYRYGMARDNGVTDEDGALKKLLLECDGLIAGVRNGNVAKPRRVRPTVIVMPGARLSDLERTLRSVAAQTLAEWDALVLDFAEAPYADIGAYIDPQGRFKTLRLTTSLNETPAIAQALRVAGGDWFLILRAGSSIVPDHLERIAATMRERDADLVRTSATYGGHPLFLPISDTRRAYVAPHGPMDALAFTRRALDSAGNFNPNVTPFGDWEFYLRAVAKHQPVALDSPVAVGVLPPGEILGMVTRLAQIARQIHAAYATTDESLLTERAGYLRELDAVLAEGLEGIEKPGGHARLIATAYGAGLLAGIG